ncbi:MAG: DUF4384 domain-containing protein [Planctomycetota bacterium]|jgi:hypothetical protein
MLKRVEANVPETLDGRLKKMKCSTCSRVVLFVVVLGAVGWLGSPAVAADEITFRDLTRRYFADGKGDELGKMVGLPGPVKHVVALDYTILLRTEEGETSVDPKDREFAIGDKIRVRIHPLNGAYVYIFYEGASGERVCLLPVEQEKVPFIQGEATLDLPGDGFFEFVSPPGDEELVVVATERPIADLSLLANVVFKKPGDDLTPEEQAIKSTFKSTVSKTLQSIRARQNAKMTYRGLPRKKGHDEFTKKVQDSGATQVVIEEPPHGSAGGTLAMVASSDESPNLLVTIPLVSIAPSSKKKP